MELKINAGMSALFLISTLSGCVASVPVNGKSAAGSALKSDTTKTVVTLAKAYTRCDRVESIQTEILRINPAGPKPLPASSQPGSVDERWTVAICGRKVPVLVTFTPDGQGGTFFRTTIEQTGPGAVL
ncbi:hypothetical protein [Sedimenticola hydrogenitrophicus]|uniref:hypothetical protein n=1 Tax=Sedimenticola hydrogenitrophicus TaxID=2967975 RepID=UPI0021A62FB9|nr:hypothetical protein [Sedimenticola hydrogenitrophicus]